MSWLDDLGGMLSSGVSGLENLFGFGGGSSGNPVNLPNISLPSISALGSSAPQSTGYSVMPGWQQMLASSLSTPSTGVSSPGYGYSGGYGSPIVSLPSLGQQLGMTSPESILAALGMIGFGGYEGYNTLQQQLNAMNFAQNPAAMMGRIRAFEQPLSQNLIHSVMRDINPSIAARGLATSPGMTQQITAEALAPYEMQEQQQAIGLTGQGLRYPFELGSGAAGWLPSALYSGSAAFTPNLTINPLYEILLMQQLEQQPQQQPQLPKLGTATATNTGTPGWVNQQSWLNQLA